MKFAEFDRIVNPTDEACYIIETPTDKIPKSTFKDIKHLLLTRNDVSIKMLVPKGLLIIETTNKKVIDAIISRKEELMIAQKNDHYYIYSKSSFNKQTTNNMLACGANANTLVHTKKGTEILLPFHAKNNILPKYHNTEIIYSNGIGQLPMWLTPVNNGTSKSPIGLDLPISENIYKILTSHVLSLASFSREQQKELLKIMNKYLVAEPLEDNVIDNMCESINDTFLMEFMNKNEFYHDKFGDYVIKACHIKKDKKTHQIYFYDDKRNIYTNDPNYLRGYITKLCPRLKQYQKDEAIKYINDMLELDAVTFNANPFNIVFKNGILHLEGLEFEPMTPDHLETIQINANYDPNAYSATADEFFRTATCGNKQVEQLLYEAMGYAMLKTVQLAKSFMVTGYGRNGKSTWFDLIMAVLGEDNCAALAPKDLSNNFRSSTLVNKLASIAADISGKPLDDTDTLKNIAAGDRIQVEKKFQDAYEERLYATLFFACNKIPKTPDTSDGFYRRWVIIPFNADLSKVKNVEGFMFKEKLLSQESIDYVAYKAVQAIFNLMSTTQEFIEPDIVAQMKASYRINNSSVLSWFKEKFTKNNSNPSFEERTKGLERLQDMTLHQAYIDYNDWCKETNKQSLARPNFEEEIKIQFGISWNNDMH